MTRIVKGTERWNQIQAHAETLRAKGALDYVNLKKLALCGGDVAHRIMTALKAEGLTDGPAEAGEKAADATAGKLPPSYQARWDVSAAEQHRIVVDAFDAMAAENVARLTAEASRHSAEIRELRENLDSALEDVDGYSTQAADAQDKLVASEAAVAELTAILAGVRERCTDAEARLATTEELSRSSEAKAQSDRTEAASASARAEADAKNWRRRAEIAEGLLDACRIELATANTRAARLEGERDAGLRAQEDLRALLQLHAEMATPLVSGEAVAPKLAGE